MLKILATISGIILFLITLFALTFLISSIWEKEKRASVFAAIQFIIFLAITLAFFWLNKTDFFNTQTGYYLLIAFILFTITAIALLILPIGTNPTAKKGTKGLITGNVTRFDERNTVFSKISKKFMDSSPEKKQPASVMIEKGKIDGPGGTFNIAMGEASSKIVRNLTTPANLNPVVSHNKTALTPDDASTRIKGYSSELGVDLVGITELNPLWIYSHYGRSGIAADDWSTQINTDHKFAIVLATEMDVDLVNTAPHTPSMMESLHNYAKGAYIATQLAKFIASLGYSAKVNQMAHYDTMMVPLAVDAGLGELSRMGYLITKEYGPRIRLSAVTTDLPMTTDNPVDIGVLDFCAKCLKCAHCCPSNSIPKNTRKEKNGTLRWTIDTDSCFEYWQKLGTDCCICMRVCPYSHPRTFPHKIITEAVTRNSLSRTLFIWMDDLFYSKHPPSKPPPPWAKFD